MRTWLKWGCLGVLAVVVFFALLTGYAFFSAWRNAGDERVEEAAHTRELPAPVETPVAGEPAAGRVVLEFEVGEFVVEPGPPGSPIRIEGEYDTNSYELEQELEQDEDGTWEYRARFGQSGLLRDSGLRAAFGGTLPKLRVMLPPDVPFALESTSEKGPCTMELGGMWLTEVDIYHEKGPLDLRFGRPTVEPLERLTVRGKQGPTEVRRVGNASPKVADIRGSMGPTEVDLRGSWVRDADVTIRGYMGPTDVHLPRNARIEGSGAGRIRPIVQVRTDGPEPEVEIRIEPPPEETDVAMPTVRLTARTWFGPTSYR
jgi:hypothetical protein